MRDVQAVPAGVLRGGGAGVDVWDRWTDGVQDDGGGELVVVLWGVGLMGWTVTAYELWAGFAAAQGGACEGWEGIGGVMGLGPSGLGAF